MADFDLKALYQAVDERRVADGLTWAEVARAVSRRPDRSSLVRQVSPSTIRSFEAGATAEGDGVLQVLLWLARAPEDFVPGHPLAGSPSTVLRVSEPGMVLRWDAAALHAALDEQRRHQDLTWTELAREIGCAPGQLTGLAAAQRVHLPLVMRHTTWLGRPAAHFTRNSEW